METKMLTIFLLLVFLNRLEVYGSEIVAVTSERFPYIASFRLYENDDHHCSGTIISRIYLLTAAHCVCQYIKHYMLYVIVGTDSFTSDEGQMYRIEKVICHENFNFDYLRNDLALVKLTKRMHMNDRVKSLPLANFNLPNKGIFTLAAWGYAKYYLVAPKNFKLIFAIQIDTNTCAQYFEKDLINDTKFCTMTKGVGACVGDSGGPVVYKGEMVGLISFGRSCSFGYPNVHVKISAYIDWIMDEIFFDLNMDEQQFDMYLTENGD